MQPSAEDRVAVGRIRDAWGIAGWFRVEPYNAPQESVLRSAKRWWLRRELAGPQVPSAAPDVQATTRELRVTRCRIHGDALVARADSIDDRSAAESLRGFEVWISRSEFPKAADGEFYWIDLIGCSVTGQGGVPLGVVSALDDHGAHPFLIVTDGTQERLVPFVDAYIESVDLGARAIRVDWNADW